MRTKTHGGQQGPGGEGLETRMQPAEVSGAKLFFLIGTPEKEHRAKEGGTSQASSPRQSKLPQEQATQKGGITTPAATGKESEGLTGARCRGWGSGEGRK